MTTLYRLYDADGILMYVGITDDTWARLKHHGRHKAWWRRVTVARFEHFDSGEEAARAERVAVESETPEFNLVYGVRVGSKYARVKPLRGAGRQVNALHPQLQLDATDEVDPGPASGGLAPPG